MNRKTIAGLIAFLTLAGCAFTSCGDAAGAAEQTDAGETGAGTEAVTETAEPDPFADFDYAGEQVRIWTSTNDPGGVGNSNYLIEGPEEETGDVVADSAFIRNRSVEELLNVDLVFTQLDNTYETCGSTISKVIMAGDDAYEFIINDLFPMATLSVQGNFMNVADAPYIDRTQSYWYEGYMDELSLDGGGHMFLMAGDFFIDVLRSAHALYFNKNLLAELYDDGELLYREVLEGTWTYDKMLSYISDCYQDLNGDGAKDEGDRYGLVVNQVWGPSIPFIISADLEYVTLQNDGSMTLAMNNERSVKLLETLNEIFHGDATARTDLIGTGDMGNQDAIKLFKAGRSLLLGYNRLGSFDDLRDMEAEVGILPYPKLDDTQESYLTSSHDTTEIGVIPVTNSKFDMTCAVLEVLNRETQKYVLPAYYETGLKVKYSRDDMSSQMIDIIHDTIGGSFALAFSSACSDIFMKASFYEPLMSKTTDFVSNYTKREKGAQKKLDGIIDSFREIDS